MYSCCQEFQGCATCDCSADYRIRQPIPSESLQMQGVEGPRGEGGEARLGRCCAHYPGGPAVSRARLHQAELIPVHSASRVGPADAQPGRGISVRLDHHVCGPLWLYKEQVRAQRLFSLYFFIYFTHFIRLQSNPQSRTRGKHNRNELVSVTCKHCFWKNPTNIHKME